MLFSHAWTREALAVAVTTPRTHLIGIHPVHAAIAASVVPLYLGALLCDIAYARTYHVQWQNFASWLIVAALVVGVVALVWALVDLFRAGRRTGRRVLYALVVAATWIAGFFAALAHGRDGWAMMPAGLVLSVVATVLAIIAAWIGFSTPRVATSVDVTP